MVHFTARRPRILAHETPLIYGLVWAKLSELHEEKSQPYLATQLFKILYRYVEYRPGRPSYPTLITWTLIGRYLEITSELQEVDIGPFTGDEAPHIEAMETGVKGLTLQMLRKELSERTVSKEEGA